MSAALENFYDTEDVNIAWENIEESIRTSAKESEWEQIKPWVDEKCSQFLDQRNQAKFQWLQDPNQSNADNLNGVKT
jgi:RNA binding exosome subunit